MPSKPGYRRWYQTPNVLDGWDGAKRVHGCIVHIDIIDGKLWIQRDGTEHGIAADLEQYGVSKDCIVLGFHAPDLRKYTGYAA